ncbi:MAG: hypothetical protein P4L50_27825 [Anaerolineaceae bacterium]|nr:hypothetical protein [Anaerolineaceae bacterium]
MPLNKAKCIVINLVLVMMAFWLSACEASPALSPTPTISGTFDVDPLFKEYYRNLGGQDLLGPAISELIDQNNLQCQYTTNALMCYNALATDSDRFYLASLGQKLGVHDDPNAVPPTPDTRIVNGYGIYPDFASLYDTLDKSGSIGKPLSQVRYNYDQQRVEQYFEKVGFYHRFDDPSGTTRLLPYGAYVCGEDCAYTIAPTDAFIPQRQEISSPFAASLERMGGLQVFGRPLTEPYKAPDGSLEQVYENVVMYTTADDPATLHLRQLPILLDMTTTPPGPKIYGLKENMVFYPVQGDLGYHVPVMFDHFIAEHGGMEISGQPIADPMMVKGQNVARQCFENYCLDYDPNATADLRTRMAPIGMQYLNKANPATISRVPFAPDNVQLAVDEDSPQITSNDPQTIALTVLQKNGGLPMPDISANVKINLPDGSNQNMSMPPTGADGKTSLTIPAMPNLANGSLVAYEICLNVPVDNPPCISDSYLIWNIK